jgi:hypothetical protein
MATLPFAAGSLTVEAEGEEAAEDGGREDRRVVREEGRERAEPRQEEHAREEAPHGERRAAERSLGV